MKCPSCGNQITSSAERCPHCGHETGYDNKKAQKKRAVMIQCIVDIAFILVGMILLVVALPELTKYNFDYVNGQYLIKDRGTLVAVITFSLGGGLLFGSFISLILSIIKLKRK